MADPYYEALAPATHGLVAMAEARRVFAAALPAADSAAMAELAAEAEWCRWSMWAASGARGLPFARPSPRWPACWLILDAWIVDDGPTIRGTSGRLQRLAT